jgi:SPP1 family predicted phage head-tail adaptor
MKRLCTFERRAALRNAFNEDIGEWQTIAEAYGAFDELKGAELFAALQTQSKITGRVNCRYTPILATVTPKDRIRVGTQLFDIESVVDPKLRHRELQFMIADHSTA